MLAKLQTTDEISLQADLPHVSAVDLERHMNDSATRIEMLSHTQKRYSYMQKLFLKVQALSDKDFETAFTTFESVLETLNKKQKIPPSDADSKLKKESLAGIIK